MTPVFSIIAATIYGNRGAEAMLETVIGRIREEHPDAKFHVFSYYPDDDKRLLNSQNIYLHSSTPKALVFVLFPLSILFGFLRLIIGSKAYSLAPESIRAIGESDALVDLAGVSFIDGREKFLPFNFLTLFPAWALGVPIVKLSQALGPFKGVINNIAAKITLPRCQKIWARGEKTYNLLSESGISNISFSLADDIAFNHKSHYALSNESDLKIHPFLDLISAKRKKDGVKGVIGICPSSVLAVQSKKQGGSYENVLTSLCLDLINQGYLVVLFPNATREISGDAERNNDLPVIRRIYKVVAQNNEKALIKCDFDVNATDIKRIIAEMDVVLVSRFHAMVGALSLAVPPAVLGWSHKYAEVMARFGLEDVVLDYKNLSREKLALCVTSVFQNQDRIREEIKSSLPEIKVSAAKPVDSLLNYVDH